jgi:hypothetical protein
LKAAGKLAQLGSALHFAGLSPRLAQRRQQNRQQQRDGRHNDEQLDQRESEAL